MDQATGRSPEKPASTTCDAPAETPIAERAPEMRGGANAPAADVAAAPAAATPPSTVPPQPDPRDWLMLAALTVMGGSAFAMIRIAIETMPPATISASRLWIGALVMYLFMRLRGRTLPRVISAGSNGRPTLSASWRFFAMIGVTGYAIPFFLFPWAQQHIESGLAGIYMAFMPISAILLAHFFADERLTARKTVGFSLGFVGIIVLMGPELLRGAAGANLAAQLAVFVAANLYSVAAIVTRRAPETPPRVMTTGVLICAALFMTPFALLTDYSEVAISTGSALSVLALGVVATGFAGYLVTAIIRSAGAGFLSLVNYMTPVWAIGVGALMFGERLDASAFAALAVILAGVGVSQTGRRKKDPA